MERGTLVCTKMSEGLCFLLSSSVLWFELWYEQETLIEWRSGSPIPPVPRPFAWELATVGRQQSLGPGISDISGIRSDRSACRPSRGFHGFRCRWLDGFAKDRVPSGLRSILLLGHSYDSYDSYYSCIGKAWIKRMWQGIHVVYPSKTFPQIFE